MTRATEFALEADASGVKWGVGVPGRAALRASVVVVVAELTSAVIVPAAGGVDEARRVEAVDELGKDELGFCGAGLAPAFVVEGLKHQTLISRQPPNTSAIYDLGEDGTAI